MTRIMLTGATGQIGQELLSVLGTLGQVIPPDRAQCDLSRPENLRKLVDVVQPDVIVNAAAYTTVDKAEDEPDLAMKINADAAGELAAAARRHRALMVHFSTDYVFDGRKIEPYDENDFPNPLGSYARSKLAGEVAVRAEADDYLIFRTSWVYAAHGNNFLKTILRLAGEREELRIVSDQSGAPTSASLIANTVASALTQDLLRRRSGEFESGLFHLTAHGKVTWHGFASAIVAGAREHGKRLKCLRIIPITTEQYPLPAQRPANSSLDCRQLQHRYGLTLSSWESGLAQTLALLSRDWQERNKSMP